MDIDINKLTDVLNSLIDNSARELVGKMCKRIECLQNNKSLSPQLLKSLNKELVYENSRVLKQIIGYTLLPKVAFVSKKSKEK